MRGLFLWLLRLILWIFRDEATRLNLKVRVDDATVIHRGFWIEGQMAKIGDSFTARIAPTNAAGAAAPVFNVVYLEDGDSYDITQSPDGMSAVLVARNSGTGNVVRVTAFTKGGVELSETVALPDVESPVDEEAVALNLTVA